MTDFDPFSSRNKLNIVQGEVRVSEDPTLLITTLVGSCISACLFDPVSEVGGLNHFLLPEDPNGGDRVALYGINQMELLINSLLTIGAKRNRLQAKLFGGNTLHAGLSDVGSKNADLAETFLSHEGIPCVSRAIRGTQAQRIQFHPTSGRARMKYIQDAPVETIRKAPVVPVVSDGAGDLELF